MLKQRSLLFDENKEGKMPDLKPIEKDTPLVKHRVYMRDWYFNAGIVGFLEILLTDDEKNKIISNKDEEVFSLRGGKIVIEDNYLEFEASALAQNGNFAHLMFQKAFDNYGKHKSYIEKLEKIKELISEYQNSEDENEKKELKDKIKRNWSYIGAYAPLEKKFYTYFWNSDPLFKLGKGNIFDSLGTFKNSINKYLKVLKDEINFQYFLEKDVVQYFSSYFADGKAAIKKQSGFLNVSIKGSRKDDFYKKVIAPIIDNKIKYRTAGRGKNKILSKSILNESKNAKETTYNSGLISFIGNSGAENYKWISSGGLYIDEISELLSWSSFAGFTNISKGQDFRFLFANQDSSLMDLYRANNSLNNEFNNKTQKLHSYVKYLTNLILSESKKTVYSLQNTIIIDIQNQKEFYVKIHSLNISKEKANFIISNEKLLNILTKNSFTDIDLVYKNLGELVLDYILKNKLNYTLVQRLIRLYLPYSDLKIAQKIKEKNLYLKNKLQTLIYLIENYKNTFYGGNKMDGSLSSVYSHGQKFARTMNSKNDGNKIRGFVAKFLNYVKSGDINSFMNLFMRIHMAYGMQTPYELKNIFENKDTFDAIGYSFINGLLNVNNKDDEKNNDNKSLDKKEN